MKKTIIIFAVLLGLITTGQVWGEEPTSDPAPFQFLGFSKTGKSLAFSYAQTPAESDIYEGVVVFVDVAKNSLAAPKVLIKQNWVDSKTKFSIKTAQDAALRTAKPTLNKLGIDESNFGKQEYLHSEILGWNTRSTSNAILNDSMIVPFKDYEVEIATITDLPAPHYTDAYSYFKPLGVKVTLRNKTTGAEKILQSDTYIPSGRKCPIQYRIKAIYTFKKYVVIFLYVLSPGFEGFPEVNYIAVTGQLN